MYSFEVVKTYGQRRATSEVPRRNTGLVQAQIAAQKSAGDRDHGESFPRVVPSAGAIALSEGASPVGPQFGGHAKRDFARTSSDHVGAVLRARGSKSVTEGSGRRLVGR